MRLRDGISLSLGGAALAMSVLGVGGAVRWTCAVVAGLVALALMFELFSRHAPARVSPLIALIALAGSLTALQIVPLPPGLLHALNATGNSLRFDGAGLAHTTPWVAISLDPAGSLRALTYFITLLGVAFLGLRFAATERGRFILLGGVAFTCGLAALVAAVHSLFNADTLYGLYLPAHMKAVVGPLLNRNHMGGLMAIGAVLSVGLSFYPRQPTQFRVLWIVIMVSCVAECAITLSRGAIVGMGIGLVVVLGILAARHLASEKRTRRSLRRDLPAAIIVGLGVTVALFLNGRGVMDQLADTSLTEFNKPISKYEAWRSSLELVREAPWVGVGRGAVEPSLTRVYAASGEYTFSHVENEYLTAVVDWGIPGALMLAVAFAWCVSAALRRWRDGPLAAAALGALAMILFQSFVDFGVELLGIAVPVTIIASTVQLVPLRSPASLVRVRFLRVLLIAGLLVSAGLLLLPMTTSIQEDHDDLLAAETPTLEQIRESIERHPLDYFGFGEAADVASRNNDIHAVEYLNHALMLHPTHPGLHRLAARMLVGLKNYRQAAVEYSLALAVEPLPHQLLTEIVTLIPNAEDATASIPLDYPNIEVMLHSLKELERPDISVKWLTRVAALPQHNLQVIDTLYELATELSDFATAKSAATLRLTIAHTSTSRLMLAKVDFQLHEFETLLKDLVDVEHWVGRTDEKGAAWLIRCDIYIEQKSWETATECLHHLDGSGLLGTAAHDISKRLQEISEQRTFESRMQAAKALQDAIDAKHGH